ncbi:MAG: GHKL domain-containing protein [Lachnospiraceae bacterium]|nr:GHKL domain-containing protein [Lachnospiraceae bacterium]
MIIDSVLNYGISHTCSAYVKPVVYGRLPEIVSVSAMDLCTVFSNMLSNAIKGANLLEEENELVIRFQGGEQFFSICVTNQTKKNENVEREKAENSDRNHGHGLKKIKEVAEKYTGEFEQTEDLEKGSFRMQIYLPI